MDPQREFWFIRAVSLGCASQEVIKETGDSFTSLA